MEAAWREGELAAIGDLGSSRTEGIGAFVIVAARKTGEAFFMKDLPDGGGAQGRAGIFERMLDVIKGKILLAHGEHELTDGALFGLGAWTGLEIAEEIRLETAEVVAKDTKGTGSVAETLSDIVGGGTVDKAGTKGFVLSLGGGSGFEKELGVSC